jgi:hypothetical protein
VNLAALYDEFKTKTKKRGQMGNQNKNPGISKQKVGEIQTRKQ